MDSAGSEMKAGDPTDLQDRILERLQTNGPATAGSLARALGVAEELVLSALFRCRKRGLVQLDKKFRWSINPKFTSGGRKVNVTDLNSFTTSELFETMSCQGCGCHVTSVTTRAKLKLVFSSNGKLAVAPPRGVLSSQTDEVARNGAHFKNNFGQKFSLGAPCIC
jgi:hypothetical protein